MAVRVLLVDDSAVIRGLMNKALSADSYINVVGTAANGKMAIDMAAELKPDIIVLDIEMPVMDGITALPELLKISPSSKVIIASTLSQRNAEISMKALSLGASDYLAKPSAKFGDAVDVFYRELIEKVKALASSHAATPVAPGVSEKIAQPEITQAKSFTPPASTTTPLHVVGVKALAVASSTGGPQALIKVFEDIKGKLQNIPIFITQHMPPTFTTIFADHLAKAGVRECIEAKDGLIAKAGSAYVAPGDYHMMPEKNPNGEVVLRLNQGPQENYCRPAADPMLRALSAIYGKNLALLVLTGMGQDGMEGAKIVVKNGGSVIAQDEATCVVYGMPKAVVDAGICRSVLPLGEIGAYLVKQIEGK